MTTSLFSYLHYTNIQLFNYSVRLLIQKLLLLRTSTEDELTTETQNHRDNNSSSAFSISISRSYMVLIA